MRRILMAIAAAALLAGCATGYGYSEYDSYGHGYGDYYYGSQPYGSYDGYYDGYYPTYARYPRVGLGYGRGPGYYGGFHGSWGYPSWYTGYRGYGRHVWYGRPGNPHRPHRPRSPREEEGLRAPPKGGPLPPSKVAPPLRGGIAPVQRVTNPAYRIRAGRPDRSVAPVVNPPRMSQPSRSTPVTREVAPAARPAPAAAPRRPPVSPPSAAPRRLTPARSSRPGSGPVRVRDEKL